MKKALIIEIVALTLVLALALGVCIRLAQPEDATLETTVTNTPAENTPDPTVPTEPEVPAWMELAETWSITSQQYFVYDTETDTFLTQVGDAQRVYPASITKLMTALVALEYLKPEEVITAGQELDSVVWGSSVAGIKFGDTLTASQLVEAMLLPSGNDAAYVIAAAAGRKILGQPNADAATAVSAFMTQMNQRAKELGLTNTHFSNPDGIHDDNHYMSFADLALLGKLAAADPTIRQNATLAIGNNPRYDETNTDEDAPKQWKNTNQLVHPDSEYYCEYAIGLKTGQTPYAGSCLLSAFDVDGHIYIIGVFGCPETTDRFGDTLTLFAEYAMG